MRARSPAGSIVLNEFQWIHHTNVIASMISSSDGMRERGDGEASGGSARQSVRMSDRNGGSKNDTECDMVGRVPVEKAFVEGDESESLGSEDMEGRWRGMKEKRGPVPGLKDWKDLQWQQHSRGGHTDQILTSHYLPVAKHFVSHVFQTQRFPAVVNRRVANNINTW